MVQGEREALDRWSQSRKNDSDEGFYVTLVLDVSIWKGEKSIVDRLVNIVSWNTLIKQQNTKKCLILILYWLVRAEEIYILHYLAKLVYLRTFIWYFFWYNLKQFSFFLPKFFTWHGKLTLCPTATLMVSPRLMISGTWELNTDVPEYSELAKPEKYLKYKNQFSSKINITQTSWKWRGWKNLKHSIEKKSDTSSLWQIKIFAGKKDVYLF